jgi:FAD:protein FMN transferase
MALLPSIKALGTQFLIEVWDEDANAKLETVHNRLEFLLSEFETNYSRFKPESHISILNQHKRISNPPSELVTLLRAGVTYYDQTQGIHNLMVGETLVNNGYDAQYSFTAKPIPIDIPNPHEVLSINDEYITLSRGQIDIGGYGKGVAIDLLATHLMNDFGLQYFLINGGGDMYGTSNHGEPILLYLEHPTETDTYLGTVTIKNQGFAASSRYKRAWIHNSISYSHIIETNRGSKNTTFSDASFITADTATTADVFATVALLATTTEMNQFATLQALGVATFTHPTSFTYNHRFAFQTL